MSGDLLLWLVIAALTVKGFTLDARIRRLEAQRSNGSMITALPYSLANVDLASMDPDQRRELVAAAMKAGSVPALVMPLPDSRNNP